jgi:hypothetical protein
MQCEQHQCIKNRMREENFHEQKFNYAYNNAIWEQIAQTLLHFKTRYRSCAMYNSILYFLRSERLICSTLKSIYVIHVIRFLKRLNERENKFFFFLPQEFSYTVDLLCVRQIVLKKGKSECLRWNLWVLALVCSQVSLIGAYLNTTLTWNNLWL